MTSKLQAWRTVKLELSKIAAGEPMTFTINNKDLPLLRERGFVSGASGQTWFNEDKEGKMWQAAEDDDGQLAFRKEISDKLWGVLTTISREQFDVLFPRENYPRTDTGE